MTCISDGKTFETISVFQIYSGTAIPICDQHSQVNDCASYHFKTISMKFKLLNPGEQKTFAVILASGDEVKESILSFAKEQKLHASQFTAIGAFSKATLGYFDFSIKDYRKIEFDEQVEVLSVAGDISMYKDEFKVHAHVVIGKKDGTAHGGHLLEAIVHPTLEIIVTESPAYLCREIDTESGLPLIKI